MFFFLFCLSDFPSLPSFALFPLLHPMILFYSKSTRQKFRYWAHSIKHDLQIWIKVFIKKRHSQSHGVICLRIFNHATEALIRIRVISNKYNKDLICLVNHTQTINFTTTFVLSIFTFFPHIFSLVGRRP